MRLTSTLLGLSCSLFLACGGSSSSSTCNPSTATGTDYQFATNQLLLPITNSYAIDIDGDGNPDNALKTLLAPLSQFVDLQTDVNMALMMGEAVILSDVKATSLTTDSCASINMALANTPASPPKFDGTDTFTVDSAAMASAIGGPITSGAISTTMPEDMGPAVSSVPTMTLSLALAGGMLTLKLWGVQVNAGVTATGLTADSGMQGIHGVILNTDVQGTIIPAVATLVTQEIQKDPTSSTTQTIIGIFETNPNGPCHTMPATCVITPAEINASPLVGSLLAPDVRVHDANGNWAPNTNPSLAKDALSVGIGFTSVKASF